MIFDRHGPRGLLLVGTLMHVFGIMMASISTKYWQILLAQGVCSGIGVSAVFQPRTFLSSLTFLQFLGKQN